MVDSIIQLRHDLHRHPEPSGNERATALRIAKFFEPLCPDEILTGLGGHGLAVVFTGQQTGPTVLLRCELDALPISESIKTEYQSTNAGVSHKCGHDGHMAILAAVGRELSIKRPTRGRVVLLYQPAEENGQGAAAVLRDPRFEKIRPHYTFALHNLPGFPCGQVIIRSGAFSSASRGMAVQLGGITSHAAQPESGLSPAAAMCQIIQKLSCLPQNLIPPHETAFATVVGASLGQKAFGTTPGRAEIWATLRSHTDDTMTKLVDYAEQVAKESATHGRLSMDIQYEDVFSATVNSPSAVDIVKQACGTRSISEIAEPFRWSEDFGKFTAICEGALFGIGAGTEIPELHHPDYDFPDTLIPEATALLVRVLNICLAKSH